MSLKQALVFGASGISGWHTMQQLLYYPTPTTFASVTGLTNRPLSLPDSFLPADPRLKLVFGVDLSLSAQRVQQDLASKVTGIADVTHVFFYSYVHQPPIGTTLTEINVRILDNALHALKALSPRLEFISFQTGGKTYGFEYYGKVKLPPLPLKEADARLPDAVVRENMFYYKQIETLQRHAQGASWKWTEVIPDAIIGFTPTANAMNLARPIAIYLHMWRHIHGAGAEVPFPGTKDGFTAVNGISPMDSVARFAIHASLHSEKSHGHSFNVTEPPTTYETRWPEIASRFGLVGVAPTVDAGLNVEEWAKHNESAWLAIEKEHGLKPNAIADAGWEFMHIMLSLPFSRHYDNSRRREIGFTEAVNGMKAYDASWEHFARAKLLPPLHTSSVAQQNKAAVLAAFDTLFNKRDYAKAEPLWSPHYVQHSALVPAGRDGLLRLAKSLPAHARYENQLIVAEGDFVVAHGRFVGHGAPLIAADILRMKDGIMVEHWDVLQEEVPRSKSASGNPMFGDSFLPEPAAK